MFDFDNELKSLPESSGVYIMRSKDGTVIYVGKAVNLKSRVRQYFQPSNSHLSKIQGILENIASFEYIVTNSEVEALILECNLIKRCLPRYNVLLKDDKSYPYLKLTLNEEFPRLFVTRNYKKDGGSYFGPYTSSQALYELLKFILKIWPLRRCEKNITSGKTGRSCLNYHIGRCLAPCENKVSPEAYQKMALEVSEFLNGKQHNILKRLEAEMLEASEKLEFEHAAEIRNAISALKEKQQLDKSSDNDRDVISFATDEATACFQVFFIRSGKMIGRESIFLNDIDEIEDSELLSIFVKQFYYDVPFIPREILLKSEIADKETISLWISQTKGKKVSLEVPQIGGKRRLVNMATENAVLAVKQHKEQLLRETQKKETAVQQIAKALCLPSLNRIEAYDISNIQGFESVASLVVFENGLPKRSAYRKFKIKSVLGPDDYASIEEVLTRRLMRYEQEKTASEDTAGNKFSELPDVIFMDGGKGQVSSALKVLGKFNLNIPVCGMIKDDNHNTRGLIYNSEEVLLPKTSEGFKLIVRIQDEVHRFAIEYHRSLRQKRMTRSVLDEINGIGEKRKFALLKKFGDIEQIKKATLAELVKTEGMNERAANAVYHFFNT